MDCKMADQNFACNTNSCELAAISGLFGFHKINSFLFRSLDSRGGSSCLKTMADVIAEGADIKPAKAFGKPFPTR